MSNQRSRVKLAATVDSRRLLRSAPGNPLHRSRRTRGWERVRVEGSNLLIAIGTPLRNVPQRFATTEMRLCLTRRRGRVAVERASRFDARKSPDQCVSQTRESAHTGLTVGADPAAIGVDAFETNRARVRSYGVRQAPCTRETLPPQDPTLAAPEIWRRADGSRASTSGGVKSTYCDWQSRPKRPPNDSPQRKCDRAYR